MRSTTIIFIVLTLLLTDGCKKSVESPAITETGVVTDIDNNTYKTVKIGDQWWMAENLKVRRYRNGNSIFNVSNSNGSTIWDTLKTGACCSFEDNLQSTGLLYNWNAVNDPGNIAPAGWHVPSDEEWKTLEKSSGMSQVDADKLSWRGTGEGQKLKLQSAWTNYGGLWATNESGFTALAGGCRLFNGDWGDPGLFSTGFWWSATEHTGNEAWYRYLDYKNANIFRSHCNKNYGFSVRCVKD